MSDCHGLPGSICRFPRGAGHLPGGGIRSKGGRAGLSHRDLTPHPSVGQSDSPARAVVRRFRLLEEMQHVHCAIGRPHCEKVMIWVPREPPRRTVTSLGSRTLVKITCLPTSSK